MKNNYKIIWEDRQYDPSDETSVLRWKWFSSKVAAYRNYRDTLNEKALEFWSREGGQWENIHPKLKNKK